MTRRARGHAVLVKHADKLFNFLNAVCARTRSFGQLVCRYLPWLFRRRIFRPLLYEVLPPGLQFFFGLGHAFVTLPMAKGRARGCDRRLVPLGRLVERLDVSVVLVALGLRRVELLLRASQVAFNLGHLGSDALPRLPGLDDRLICGLQRNIVFH